MGKGTTPKRSLSRRRLPATPAEIERYVARTLRATGRELKRYRKEKGVDERFMAGVLGITVKFYRRCEAGQGRRLRASAALRYASLYPRRERDAAISRFCGAPPPTAAERRRLTAILKKLVAAMDAMPPEERVKWDSHLRLRPEKKIRNKKMPVCRQ